MSTKPGVCLSTRTLLLSVCVLGAACSRVLVQGQENSRTLQTTAATSDLKRKRRQQIRSSNADTSEQYRIIREIDRETSRSRHYHIDHEHQSSDSSDSLLAENKAVLQFLPTKAELQFHPAGADLRYDPYDHENHAEEHKAELGFYMPIQQRQQQTPAPAPAPTQPITHANMQFYVPPKPKREPEHKASMNFYFTESQTITKEDDLLLAKEESEELLSKQETIEGKLFERPGLLSWLAAQTKIPTASPTRAPSHLPTTIPTSLPTEPKEEASRPTSSPTEGSYEYYSASYSTSYRYRPTDEQKVDGSEIRISEAKPSVAPTYVVTLPPTDWSSYYYLSTSTSMEIGLKLDKRPGRELKQRAEKRRRHRQLRQKRQTALVLE